MPEVALDAPATLSKSRIPYRTIPYTALSAPTVITTSTTVRLRSPRNSR